MARINGAEFDRLSGLVGALDTEYWRARYRAGDFPRAELVRDVDKRGDRDAAEMTDLRQTGLIPGAGGVPTQYLYRVTFTHPDH